MRQILVDYARKRDTSKRDGGVRIPLEDSLSLNDGRSLELTALDDALNDLARLDLQQSRIVELRFFGGLSIEETADVLEISAATVKRHWTTAKAFLHREMTRAAGQGTDGNFYRTTNSGGTNNFGAVFKITPSGTLTTLYSFSCRGSLSSHSRHL